MLNLVHRLKRQPLEAEHSFIAKDVIATLNGLFNERGEPAYIRSDNGPEFIDKALKHWLATSGGETLYIETSEAGSMGERLLGDLHQPATG